jgi:hypothetical protein
MYKVPGRSIYCDTLLGWVQEVIWCYVVMKLFKMDIDAITTNPSMPPISE